MNDMLKDYSHQPELCRYLQENQYLTRTEWAAVWASQHRLYNTITSSLVERMHKVLKNYLMNSTGELLCVVRGIEQMVKSQYSKYTNEIASSKHRTNFQETIESMPFLHPGIHEVLTPPAIERIRQQNLLRQKEQRQRCGGHPCSGLFEKTNGLPCRHTLRVVMAARSALRLNHLYDDHWRYQREKGPSLH